MITIPSAIASLLRFRLGLIKSGPLTNREIEKLDALLAHPEFDTTRVDAAPPETPSSAAGVDAVLPSRDIPMPKREGLDR